MIIQIDAPGISISAQIHGKEKSFAVTKLRGDYSSKTPKTDFEKGVKVHRYSSNHAPTHPSPRNRKYINEALNRDVENIFLTLNIERKNWPSKVADHPSDLYCRLSVNEDKH